jgi:WD repeat-containing protein 48
VQARKVEDLQKCDYEEEIKKRSKRIFIPNWFTVDLKIGVRSDNVTTFQTWGLL